MSQVVCICGICKAIYPINSKHTCKPNINNTPLVEVPQTDLDEQLFSPNSATSENSEVDFTDLDELLIYEISKRPPIFDHRLPIKERSKNKIMELWIEIHEVLKEYMSLEDMKRRWRSIRDRYVRSYKTQTEYVPSGSGSTTKEKPYKYYHLLAFLNDSLQKRRTYSNLSREDQNEAGNTSVAETYGNINVENISQNNEEEASISRNIAESNSNYNASSRKRKAESIETALLKKLNEPSVIKTEDETDQFCNYFGSQLRKLTPQKRSEIQLKVMQLIHNELYII